MASRSKQYRRTAPLIKRNNKYISNIPHVITAACILPNVCEIHHEHFNDAWIQSKKVNYVQPEAVARDTLTGSPQDVRNALMEYFQHNHVISTTCTCYMSYAYM